MSEFDGDVSMVGFYYNRLFPFDLIKTWLTYDNELHLQYREFSYILHDGTFIRFEAFKSDLQFSLFIRHKQPVQMLLGAIYNASPVIKKQVPNFRPMQKELVFDIDLTPYDDVRTCCSAKKMCNKCWLLMEIATKILDALLRIDFGFKDLLWVFSARRGLHCIVCDHSARILSADARRALLSFANVVRHQNQLKKVHLHGRKIHTSIQRALTIINPYVKRIIEEQDLFGTPNRVAKFMKMLKTDDIFDDVETALLAEPTSVARWDKFVEIAKSEMYADKMIVEEYCLQLAYPRFDFEVTVQMAHLYKIPFSIHHVNGRIAVPFDPKLVEQFDPSSVPSLRILDEELNRNFDPNVHPIGKPYMYTSLSRYVTYFEQWVNEFVARNQPQINSKVNR